MRGKGCDLLNRISVQKKGQSRRSFIKKEGGGNSSHTKVRCLVKKHQRHWMIRAKLREKKDSKQDSPQTHIHLLFQIDILTHAHRPPFSMHIPSSLLIISYLCNPIFNYKCSSNAPRCMKHCTFATPNPIPTPPIHTYTHVHTQTHTHTHTTHTLASYRGSFTSDHAPLLKSSATTAREEQAWP